MNTFNDKIYNDDLVKIILLSCASNEDKSNNQYIFKLTTKLQKILFLVMTEFEEIDQLKQDGVYFDEPLEYFANKYGPYSYELQLIIENLIKDEEISMNKLTFGNCYEINNKLIQNISKYNNLISQNLHLSNLIEKVVDLYKYNLQDLLKYVYNNEDYTSLLSKSIIKHKYL
jgi:uncharacterized protein YwgA